MTVDLTGIAAVSYTHLDVYKRQVRDAAFAEMLAADQRTAEESRAGVRPKGAR